MRYKLPFNMLCLTIVLLSTVGYSAAANSTLLTTETATYVPIESLSTAAQTNVPVTFCQIFAPGDIPAGSSVPATYLNGTHRMSIYQLPPSGGDPSARCPGDGGPNWLYRFVYIGLG